MLQSAECECAEHVCSWSSFIHRLALSLWMSLAHTRLSCNALTLICSQIRFTALNRACVLMSLSGLLLHRFLRGSDITACAQTETKTRFMFLCLLINTTDTVIVATDNTATRRCTQSIESLFVIRRDQTQQTPPRGNGHTHTHTKETLWYSLKSELNDHRNTENSEY